MTIVGTKHGRLTILAVLPNGKHPRAHVRCDCGTEKYVQVDNLSRTHSCGCLKREQLTARSTTHGLSRRPEFHVWLDIKARCSRPQRTEFPNYGGRGIRVDARWLHDFEAFFRDMGERPSARHTIDRIDNDGDYTPTNCRWATRRTQRINQRRQVLHTHDGVTGTLKDHARRVGLSYSAVHQRMTTLGWSLHDALMTPVQVKNPR